MIERFRYTRTAIALHWLIAVLVFAGWGLGKYMHDLPASPAKLQFFSWHKWLGVTVFALALARAVWRVAHPAPPLPGSVPAWEQSLARASHALLYLLLLALPLSGWLMSSAKGFQTVYFGVLPLPDLLTRSEPLGKLLTEVHELLAYALAALVGLHVAGALKHAFVDRDEVLGRMIPLVAAFALIGATFVVTPIDRSESRVTATFRQMNVPVTAEFTSVRGGIAFRPDAVRGNAARIVVETSSFTLGEPDYDSEARGPEWLDAEQHPVATFLSDSVHRAGPDRYRARGRFTLKGRTIPLVVTFAVHEVRGQRVFEGEFPISRKQFGIGSPAWERTLEDTVVVRFHITAKP